MMEGYAELHCLSNFSFQRGASSARELFERAKRQGYSALAITDECTLAGIVRAWQAAKAVELPLIIGSEMRIENGPKLVLLVQDLSGYQHLCRLITLAPTLAADQQPFAHQAVQRFAHGDSGDAQLVDELALGRQGVVGRQDAIRDRIPQHPLKLAIERRGILLVEPADAF